MSKDFAVKKQLQATYLKLKQKTFPSASTSQQKHDLLEVRNASNFNY